MERYNVIFTMGRYNLNIYNRNIQCIYLWEGQMQIFTMEIPKVEDEIPKRGL